MLFSGDYSLKSYPLTPFYKLFDLFQRFQLLVVHIKSHLPIINESVSTEAHLVLEIDTSFRLILY